MQISECRKSACVIYLFTGSLNVVLPTLSQLSLLPPKSANTTLPTLGQLSTELRHFENWYLLGLQLNISKDTLDSIEKTHDTQVMQCVEMIQYWISNCKNPTWEALHRALMNIGESVLAAEIAGKYNIQPIITREEKSPAQSYDTKQGNYDFLSSSTTEEKLPALMHSSSKEKSESSSSTELLTLQQIVRQEQRRVISYFAIIMDRITDILGSLVKPEKLLRFLRFHCHPLNPEIPYIDQHILQCTSSVSEIMECLVPDYINYMNTELLELIIERFECKEAQSLLQQYHDRYPRLLQDMPNPVSDEILEMTRHKSLRAMCESDLDSTRAVDIKRIQTAIESATGQFVTLAQQHSEG